MDIQARLIVNGKVNPYVFVTETGAMVAPHNLARDFAKWKRRNEFPIETRIQDLRRSHVSLLIKSGVDIKVVQDLMRHSDPRTTMKMYLRTRDEIRQAAVADLRSKIMGESKTRVRKKRA